MTPSTEMVFGLYACQKWIYQPEIWHAKCPGTVLQHILRFLEILKISILQSHKILAFYFWGYRTIFRKIWDSQFKELFILRLGCFLFAFYFKSLLSVIFWNIYAFDQKRHDIESLKSVLFKSFQGNFPKILCEDVKYTHGNVCQVSRRHL